MFRSEEMGGSSSQDENQPDSSNTDPKKRSGRGAVLAVAAGALLMNINATPASSDTQRAQTQAGPAEVVPATAHGFDANGTATVEHNGATMTVTKPPAPAPRMR
jgi:hypothetical protein